MSTLGSRPNSARLLIALCCCGFAVGCDGDGVLTPRFPGADDSDATARAPAIVRLVPSAPSYRVGEIVVIAVEITHARDVGSVPFHLRYDPDVLRFQPPAEEGDFMGQDGTATVFLASDTGGGGELVVGVSRLQAPAGARGAGTLAVFRFFALTPGPCRFEFSGASVKDPTAMNLAAAFETTPVDVHP